MPSEMVDREGLASSSFFSEEVQFPNERHVGFWKTETNPDSYGSSPVAPLNLEKQMPMPSQVMKNLKLTDPCMVRNQKVSGSLEKYAVGAERAVNYSFGRSLEHDPGKRSFLCANPVSNCIRADGINVMGAQYENGLFSSSLSELFSRKLRLSSNHAPLGHSVGAAASRYEEEEEPIESLKEIEAQTIGNLLPTDDDLLSGLTDGVNYLTQPNMSRKEDEVDDLDLFSSVGGLDLGEDGFSGHLDYDFSEGNFDNQLGGSISAFAGEHPYGELPSRTLFVRNINSNVEDSELQTLFELYGDIRALYTACKHRGFVMISYYDIRAARNAMRALQNKPLRRRKLDIHFSIPKNNSSEKEINQGTLLVFNLDSSVSYDDLRQIFSAYGEIKEICNTQGSHHKSIEFYDIRAAEAAYRALNRSEIAGKQINIETFGPGGAKWSGIAPFPLDSEQDEACLNLQQIRSPTNTTPGLFGTISHGGVNNGSIPGMGQGPPSSRYMENLFHQGGISSSSVPNNLSLVRVESLGNPSSVPGHGQSQSQSQSQGQLKLGLQATLGFHPHSLPEHNKETLFNGNRVLCNSPSMVANLGARPSERVANHQFHRAVGSNGHPHELNDTVFGNGNCPTTTTTPGHHYMWSNSQRPQPLPQGMMWPNSPTFVNGVHAAAAHPPRMHTVSGSPSQRLNTLLPVSNHHVGSAPSLNPSSLWERRHSYGEESPRTSGFHPGSLGSMRISGNSPHHLDFFQQNMFPHIGGNYVDMSTIPSKNVALQQRCMMLPSRGQMIPMMSTSFEPPNERVRSRRNEGNSNQSDNKRQFELDIDRIMRGDDKRTTLMLKNIPNKYTSKMLLAAIDERHRGTYDFIYLPIDFKNKCNVGYAFINIIDPSLIPPFYQAFNGKKWEKFNSEKVASLAYARIQGKSALIAHFQNSSLMNEDKRCRPILFNTDGPNAGDQVPFPMGVNVRPRPGKNRASTSEENYQEGSTNMCFGEEMTYEDSTCTKDSD